MTFKRFDNEQSIAEFAREWSPYFSPNDTLSVVEIGDGNLNFVYRVASDQQSVIVKQALPYIRVIGEGWPLTQDRIRIEAQSLQLMAKVNADLVPEVYHFSALHCAIVMEDIGTYQNSRDLLCRQALKGEFIPSLATSLANHYFETSALYLSSQDKKAQVVKFDNPELCNISEEVYFWDPFCDHERNQINPLIRSQAQMLWSDEGVNLRVAQLKQVFMEQPQVLLHGDLHTGSLFIKGDQCKIIDPEFAFYGPLGFDLGVLVANLLLSYVGHLARKNTQFGNSVLSMISTLWQTFSDQFSTRMASNIEDPNFSHARYQAEYLSQVFQDSLGFAAIEMARRTIGIAHVADIESIDDNQQRAIAERLSLMTVQYLLTSSSSKQDMADVLADIKGLA